MNLLHSVHERIQAAEPVHLVAAIIVGLLLLHVTLGLVRGLRRWIVVGIGTRAIPCAPEGNWLLGHVIPLATSCAWEKMYEWVKARPPLIRFRILHRTGVVIGDPYAVKRVFQVSGRASYLLRSCYDRKCRSLFTISAKSAVSWHALQMKFPFLWLQTRFKLYDKDLDFSYKPFLSILGSGLVTANGDHWQKQRILMAPALRIDMLDAILPIAKRATERFSEKFERHRGTGEPVDVEEEFRLLTLQVIGEAILSLPPEECDRVFPALYLPVMEESNKRVLQPWRYMFPLHVLRYNSNVRQLNSYIIGIIRQRRAARAAGEKPQGDILDRILTSVEERGEKWGPAVETQLCYEIKTFLLAGHETSAAMLTWSVYELSKNSAALEAVRKDAAAAGLDAGTESPKREAVDAMEYTLGCLKESLRKYSVVPVVTRNMNAADELGGYKLPAGSWIICHIQRIHHLYKDPLTWRPERFLPGGEYDQFDDDIRPYMFLPFIQGPRNCLGQYFALLEARVVLGTLCQRFTFKPVNPEAVTHPTVIPVGPVGGMKMYVS